MDTGSGLCQELLVFGADLLGTAAFLLGGLFPVELLHVSGAGRAGGPGRGRRHLPVLQFDLLGTAALLLDRDLGAVLQDHHLTRRVGPEQPAIISAMR